MRLPRRDIIATALVATGGALYWLWAADATPGWLSGTRATGLVILVLGFAASASAVVPKFEQLLHGSKTYLVVTSMLGLAALAAGVQMLMASSELGLAVLIGTMGLLWLMATVHHARSTDAPAETRRTVTLHRSTRRPRHA